MDDDKWIAAPATPPRPDVPAHPMLDGYAVAAVLVAIGVGLMPLYLTVLAIAATFDWWGLSWG